MVDLVPWYSFSAGGTDTPISFSEHDKAVSYWCESVFEEAKADLEQYEEIVNLEKAVQYLCGKQWVERRPSYKASPVSNRMWTNLIQLVSYLTDIRQSFEVKANNQLYDNHAVVLNKLVRAWFFSEDFDMTMAMIIIHAALTIGYGRLVWNPELKNGEGDLELTACGAMDVIPIRPEHNLQKSLGLVYRAPKPLSWFQEKYPTKGFAVPADKDYSRFMSLPGPGSGQGIFGKAWQVLSPQMRRLFGQSASQYRDSIIPMSLYREFWLRDNQKNTSDKEVFVGDIEKEHGYKVQPGQKLYPRGRLICMGGPIVLYDGPNPFWHGQFPFAALRMNRVPWQFLGISEMRNQMPLQDIINNILAGILDAVKKAVNPPLLAPDNAFGSAVKRNLDPNMPGAKVFYSPASINEPHYAQSPVLPSFVFQTMLWAEQELDNQAGFVDLGAVSRKGIIPAADTLEQMKEGQQTLVRLKVRYIEGFLKDIGQQFVPNLFQFYNMKRRIQILGQDGLTWEDYDYNPGTMIPAGIDAVDHCKSFQFMITPGSLLKSARAPQQALMMALRRQGDMSRNRLLDSLDLGGMEQTVHDELEQEGKEVLINIIRTKMGASAGGGGVNPNVINSITNSPPGGGEPGGAAIGQQ